MIDSFLMSMSGIMVGLVGFVCQWIDEVVVGEILQETELVLRMKVSCCPGIPMCSVRVF